MYKPETIDQKRHEYDRMCEGHKVSIEVECIARKWSSRKIIFPNCWDINCNEKGLMFKTQSLGDANSNFYTSEIVDLVPAASTWYRIVTVNKYEHFNIL